MAPSSIKNHPQTCDGRTCLKWSRDGSLSIIDKQEILRRLCALDPEFSRSTDCMSLSGPTE